MVNRATLNLSSSDIVKINCKAPKLVDGKNVRLIATANGTENGTKSQHANDSFNTVYANMKLFPTSITTAIRGGVVD